MRLYTGKPRNRFGYAFEDWKMVKADSDGRHFEKQLPACVHQEIKGIWGISIGLWFIGVQLVEMGD